LLSSRKAYAAVGIVLTGAILFGVEKGIEALVDRLNPNPPPIADQLQTIAAQEERRGRRVLEAFQADIKGFGGSPSQVVVFRDLGAFPIDPERFGKAGSDEIVIYDEHDGRLEPAFRFRPEQREPIYVFRVEAVDDLDNNGRTEIVGAFYQVAMAPIQPRPVLIRWRADHGYELRAILTRAAVWDALRGAPGRGEYATFVRKLARQPTQLRDAQSGMVVETYPVENFVLSEGRRWLDGEPAGAVLVAAYVAEGHAHCCVTQLQLAAWPLDLLGSELVSWECASSFPTEPGDTTAPRRSLFSVRPGETVDEALTRAWAAARARSFC
jgi:hypothetical protein